MATYIQEKAESRCRRMCLAETEHDKSNNRLQVSQGCRHTANPGETQVVCNELSWLHRRGEPPEPEEQVHNCHDSDLGQDGRLAGLGTFDDKAVYPERGEAPFGRRAQGYNIPDHTDSWLGLRHPGFLDLPRLQPAQQDEESSLRLCGLNSFATFHQLARSLSPVFPTFPCLSVLKVLTS